ncbi:MAG: carbohydrate binding domain-containing protein [Bacteroidota bacterium]
MKNIVRILILFISFSIIISSCIDDDGLTSINETIPTNIEAIVTFSSDNSGTVTIEPFAQGAAGFQILFGDEENEEPTEVPIGESASNVYGEGTFMATITAVSVSGGTASITEDIMISFDPPENLAVDIQTQDLRTIVTPSATGVAAFDVFFGIADTVEAVTIAPGESAEGVFPNEGEFQIVTVARSSGAASTRDTSTVTVRQNVVLPLGFESTRPMFTGFEGAFTEIISNPASDGTNQSTTVARTIKSEGSTASAGSFLELDEPINFNVFNQIAISVNIPVDSASIVLRLEPAGGSSIDAIEVDALSTVVDEWQELLFDFRGEITTETEFQRITIVFDTENTGSGAAFLFDNIVPQVAPTAMLPEGFEADTIPVELFAFGGTIEEGVIANPFPSGINRSENVGTVIKGNGASATAGVGIRFAQNIDFSGLQFLTVDVFSPRAGVPIRLRAQDASDFNTGFDVTITNTLGGQWEELFFDFAGVDLDQNLNELILFFDDGNMGDGTNYLFDNFEFSNGGGAPPMPDPEPELGPIELLTNGDFENGAEPWLAGVENGIDPGLLTTDGGNTFYSVNVDSPNPDQPFLVNLSQMVEIINGSTYILTFTAFSDVSRGITAGIGLSDGDFSNNTETVNLSTESQTFTLILPANGFGAPNARVLFDLNGESGMVNIDDVSLLLFNDGLLSNGNFEDGAVPWTIGTGTDPVPIAMEDGNSFYSVDVQAAGAPFDVNMSQTVQIAQGETYTLTFNAWSNVSRSIIAGIGLSDGDFSNNSVAVNLSTEIQNFTLTLTADGFGANNARVLFDNGAEIGVVNIDNVSLVLVE